MSDHAYYPQGIPERSSQADKLCTNVWQKEDYATEKEVMITADELYGNAKSHIEGLQDEIEKTLSRLTELKLKQRMFVAQVEAYNASQPQQENTATYDGTPQLASR